MGSGKSAIGNYLAGRHAQAEKDLGSAVTFFSAALKVLPDVPDLLRQTFVLMIIEGHIEEALPLAERLLDQNVKSPIAHLALLVDAIKNGNADQQMVRLQSQPPNRFEWVCHARPRSLEPSWRGECSGRFEDAHGIGR